MARKLTTDEFAKAAFGTKIIKATDGATTSNTGAFDGFVIAEDDSVITVVLDDKGNNVTSLLGLGAGRAIKKGNTVTFPGLMGSITVGTGTINAIKARP